MVQLRLRTLFIVVAFCAVAVHVGPVFLPQPDDPLDSRISADFVETPLREFLTGIANEVDVKLVIDEAGLSEEGVGMTSPITFQVEGPIAAKTVLNMALEELHLGYFFDEHGQMVVTSEMKVPGFDPEAMDVGCNAPIAWRSNSLFASEAVDLDSNCESEEASEILSEITEALQSAALHPLSAEEAENLRWKARFIRRIAELKK